MKPSEIMLLRKGLVKTTTEYRNFQKKMANLEISLTKKMMLMEMKNDRLRWELAKCDRRIEKYEKADASTDSLCNIERAAYVIGRVACKRCGIISVFRPSIIHSTYLGLGT